MTGEAARVGYCAFSHERVALHDRVQRLEGRRTSVVSTLGDTDYKVQMLKMSRAMEPFHVHVRALGLGAVREARGLSRVELALMTGITPMELAAIEHGLQGVNDPELRVRLLRALRAEWTDVFQAIAVDPLGRTSPLDGS